MDVEKKRRQRQERRRGREKRKEEGCRKREIKKKRDVKESVHQRRDIPKLSIVHHEDLENI